MFILNYIKDLFNLFDESSLDSNKNSYYMVDEIVGGAFLAYKKYLECLENNKNLVILISSTYKANKLYASLANLVKNKEDIILFLENEMIRVEYISEGKDILANRVYSLSSMINAKHKIFILTPSSFYRFYPSKEEFLESSIRLKVGETFSLEDLISKLAKIGYYKVSKIDQSLQFATRGDVVDVFSINYDKPLRIEFFDDEIESIRFFDIENQLSSQKVDEVSILPATTLLFNEEEKSQIKNKIENRLELDLPHVRDDLKDILKLQVSEDVMDLETNNYSSRLYKYYGFLKQKRHPITSYLSNFETIVLEKDDFLDTKEILYKESLELLTDLAESGKSISHLEYFDKSIELIDPHSEKNYYLTNFSSDYKKYKKIELSTPLFEAKKGNEYTKVVDMYLSEYKQLVFVVKNKAEFTTLLNYFKFLHRDVNILNDLNDKLGEEINLVLSDFNISLENKDNSFVLVTSKLLFNVRHINTAYSSKFREGVIIGSYEELEKDDFVVHEKYGIGQYKGVKQIKLANKTEDYLEIMFANNDELFVPLYSFNLIRKYAGQEGKIPKLSSLHSDTWKKTKKKIKDKVNDLADKLLVLYKDRATVKGYKFPLDDYLQEEFENEFPYELTPDQKISLEEIKKDMESDVPMDRLLCGDVGFGKTEIAFRAAFKAILGNKQVLIIAPTTLLAKQHYEVALDRFRKFDLNIRLLTRNQSTKEVKSIFEEAKDGKINILIGTHKALNSKLEFANLGLLIIDEEQRFGVEQKEKIKIKKENIDVLTLSATPIPRTLQSSLVGLKSISTIQTPPKERLPIQLYVIQKDYKVLKEVISRELARNGQIYFVHNNIFDIYEVGEKLHELLPDMKIGIIHGKMNKDDIDQVMTSFYVNEIDLLLATTIIENGIDVRNANLIIVDEADKYGLAQLYQIKGRVGRSDKMAYCYLLINKNKKLNDDAKKRLKAIQDFTELGSGYKIAQRDLLIRGAGEILGREQAGFIDDVGIDLYLKLLNEALKERENGQFAIESENKEQNRKILLNKDAYIPETFASNNEKIELYQKINEADTFDKLNNLRKYIKDNYGGEIPESFSNLLEQREIDIYLSFKEFEELDDNPNFLNLTLSKEVCKIEGIGTDLFMALINYASKVKMTYLNKTLNLIIDKTKNQNYIDTLLNVLKIIHKEALKHEIR